ncbi:hypothetical protein [Haloferula sp.]|uniref:hypothetical protein n=1 Tax=Haloferula sp. TaxID=2497595 RepID=UPI00329B85F2
MEPVPTHSMAWGPVILIVLLLTLIPGTILGWVAAMRILQSEGRLYGLRLAALAGLFFPAILLILIPIASLFMILRIGALSTGMLADDAVLIGAFVFGTVALLCVKIFQGLLRRILGKGRFRDSFGFKKNRLLLVALVLIWACLGTALYLQRPRIKGQMISSESSDRMFHVTASTWHRMRIFGSDELFYRFNVQGRGGSVHRRWEIPVPTSELSENYLAAPISDYYFDSRGSIHWSDGNSEVLFKVDGIEVFRAKLDELPGWIPSATADAGNASESTTAGLRFAPEHEMTIPYPRAGSRTSFLDLDTRKFLEGDAVHSFAKHRFESTNAKPEESDRKIEEWASGYGADLMSIQIKPEIRTALYGGRMAYEPSLDYDSATPIQVLEAAAKLPQDPPAGQDQALVTAFGPKPGEAIVFRTREGGIGLLDLRKSPEFPKGGLIVRYKTVLGIQPAGKSHEDDPH